jgi:hypothetical protein
MLYKKTLHFTKKQDLPQSNRSKDKFTNRTTIDVQLSDVMILLCKTGHESNLRPGLVFLTNNNSMRATTYVFFVVANVQKTRPYDLSIEIRFNIRDEKILA